MGGEPVLKVRGLAKSFGSTRALAGVDLDLSKGSIHGLIGENGSGKSTFIKVLAGYHTPDSGTVRLNGIDLTFPVDGASAQRNGLSFVHQDFGLFPSSTAAENLFASEISSRRRRWAVSRRDSRRANRVFQRYDFDVDANVGVDRLSMAQRAKLAIIRAVEQTRDFEDANSGLTRLLVLDEATAPLPEAEVKELFVLVRKIAASGDSVIFVSHHLSEVLELTDHTTVLREGRIADSRPTAEFTEGSMVQAVVGRPMPPKRRHAPAATEGQLRSTRIRGLTGEVLRGVDVEVPAGKVVGLAGLPGSGVEEVIPLLFGSARAASGVLESGTAVTDISRQSPSRAVKAGIAHVSGDRLSQGGYMDLDLTDNLLGQVMATFSRWGLLGKRRMEAESRVLLEAFNVVPARPAERLRNLSGGNQQKVIVSKWLQARPHLLLLQDPTSGVDIGARESILELIRETASRGTAVLCSSSDFAELSRVADLIVVIVKGRVTQVLEGDQVSETTISACVYDSSSS